MEDFANPRECLKEDRRDLDSPEIASRQNEHPGFARSQRRDLQRTVSQSLILGEDHPAPFADRLEPDAILLIASEMLVVNLN